MNIIDICLILILIMFALVGFKKGIIKEGVAFTGIIVMFIIAFSLKGTIGNFLCKFLPFFQFGGNLKGVIAINILLYQLIAFLIIYSLLYSVYIFVLHLSGVLQKMLNLTIVLVIPSKIAGAIISFIKGYIIIFIIIMVLMIPLKDNELFNQSKLTRGIIEKTPIMSNMTSNITKSIIEVYELGDQLGKGELTTNEANLKTVDAMLKYKVVSPKVVEQLVVLDKLKGINGIENIINKYK